MKLQQRPSSTWKEKGAQRGWNPGEQLMIHIAYPPTQGPLCLPWGASSRVCFHCAIQNKWKLQMRTGHSRNWNHEVHKKNTKNTHIIVCCSLCVCVLPSWSLWLCGDGGVCFTPRNRWGKLCLYSGLLVSSMRPQFILAQFSFWSCLSKQIKSHNLQNVNMLMSVTTKLHWLSFIHKCSILSSKSH